MNQLKNAKSFRHFARHLLLVNKVYVGRDKARKEVDAHIERMRKSIMRMSLTYSDVDKLKHKIDKLVDMERRYAKFFKPEDSEIKRLKNSTIALEQELKNEREEKFKILNENNAKISQLTESLTNIKNQMKYLQLEKAKRHHRLKALESKIKEKVDVHSYYHH